VVSKAQVPSARPELPSDVLTPPEVRRLSHDNLDAQSALENAVRIAKFYAGTRQLVDKTQIKT
jgi:hypothetical protein